MFRSALCLFFRMCWFLGFFVGVSVRVVCVVFGIFYDCKQLNFVMVSRKAQYSSICCIALARIFRLTVSALYIIRAQKILVSQVYTWCKSRRTLTTILFTVGTTNIFDDTFNFQTATLTYGSLLLLPYMVLQVSDVFFEPSGYQQTIQICIADILVFN